MKTQTIKKIIREIIFSLVPAILIAFFINYFVTEAAVVEQGPSMQPNLLLLLNRKVRRLTWSRELWLYRERLLKCAAVTYG